MGGSLHDQLAQIPLTPLVGQLEALAARKIFWLTRRAPHHTSFGTKITSGNREAVQAAGEQCFD